MCLSCALTGHRDLPADFDYEKLEKAIVNLMREGVKNFYCGLARGFDLTAAVYIIKHKNEYGAKLIGCIPCRAQDRFYYEREKSRYAFALENCDETVCLAEGYYAGCMQARDRYMGDRADEVLCYLTKNSGGTFYTVNSARKKGLKIINIKD